MKKITILVPAYNEASNLAMLVESLDGLILPPPMRKNVLKTMMLLEVQTELSI